MDLSITQGVAMVTLYGIPNTPENLVFILGKFAELDINIDMISRSASLKEDFNLSFTLSQGKLNEAMLAIKSIKKAFPPLFADINGYNAKITFKSEKMKDESGTASSIFSMLLKQGVEVKMITTSETEISCLIDEKDIYKFKTEK
ncbi:MAG: ACT domain-containing protein [Clostridia bacterium]|nr:ACT domain-containing protein [Clostridia bacterium]